MGPLVLLVIFPWVFGSSFPQTTNRPMSLSISASERIFKIGTEVKIKATLSNLTDHVITLHDRIRECDYSVEVRDEKGNLAPETPDKQELKCDRTGILHESRNILLTLKPHQATEEEIVVTRLFELRVPGEYSVHVTRKVPEQLGGAIESNLLTITMTQ